MRIAFVLLLAACAEQPDTTVENVGRGCAYAWPPRVPQNADLTTWPYPPTPDSYNTRAFAVDQPALVWVVTRASPCATNLRAECTVTHQGSELIVSNTASWDEPKTQCLVREAPPSVFALCATMPLQHATYDVYFGAEHTSLAVPGNTDKPCFATQD